MRAPSFIRSLSSRFSMARRSASSMVVPLVEESRFSQQVTLMLDDLRSSEHDVGSAGWLSDVLGATMATQKLAHEFLDVRNIHLSDTDKEMIEEYLEDNIELLDACNNLILKTGIIQNYVNSVKASTRLLQGRSDLNVSTSTLAQKVLSRCATLEKQCAELDKCDPKLCGMIGRKLQVSNVSRCGQDFEMQEVLKVSREAAFVACHYLQRALSFKSKPSLTTTRSKISTSWNVTDEDIKCQKKLMSRMMNELELLVTAHCLLHNQVKSCKGNICTDCGSLRKNCEALEKEIKALEESVQELYKHLISIRMALLGMLSYN